MKRVTLSARMLWRLVRLSAAHPAAVLLGAALALILALIPLRHLRIDSDMLSLLPKHSADAQLFRETLERFGTADLLLVGLELGEAGASDENLEYADMLAEALRGSALVDQVTYRASDFKDDAEKLVDRITLFLESSELSALQARFTEAGAQSAARRIAEMLNHPLEGALQELLVKDPMDVLSLLSGRPGLSQLGSGFGSNGYLVDRGEQLLLISVRAKGSAADLPFSRKLMGELNALRTRIDAAWSEENSGIPPVVIFGGGYPVAAAEGALVTQDMLGGVIFSLISVILLFTCAFGRLRALLISGLPLLLGIMLTFAFLALSLGRLNSATSAFAALLIGLAVDFIIVLYSRYLEVRGRGFGHARALAACFRGSAQGVLLGAITTAATFFAFLHSSFPALSELGLITGVGILILVVTVFALLPALLTLLERKQTIPSGLPRTLGIERLATWCGHRRRMVLAVAVVLTLVLAAFVPRVVYDDDVRHMRSPKNPGIKAQERMMDVFGMRMTPLMVLVQADDEDALLGKISSLAAALDPLVDGEHLAKCDAPLRAYPRAAQQARNIAQLQAEPIDEDAFRKSFARALEREGLTPAPFLKGLEPLLAALRLERPQMPSELAQGSLAALLGRYLVRSDQGCSALVYCYTPKHRWHNQLPPGLSEAVGSVEGARLTGPVVLSMALKRTVWKDARLAMVIGSLVVLLLMIWDLGSLRAGLLASLPLGLGMVWMLGAMGALGIAVNFTNIFVFTMIIGIGVDYGIHFVHSQLEGQSPKGVAGAILIAAATTLLGFGSLAFSHYPGLRSLGLVAIIGTSATALISITVLPALNHHLKPKERHQARTKVPKFLAS